jgi:hypothetical protein
MKHTDAKKPARGGLVVSREWLGSQPDDDHGNDT